MELVKNSTNAMTESIASSTEEMMQTIQEEREDCITSMEELSTDMLNKLNQQIDKANKFNVKVTTDISEAADRLGDAVEELDDQMQEKIKDTFITFDQQLTHIVSHLAGVLQEMEKVSKSTKNSYDGISGNIEEQFDELQSKLEQYLEYADKLHHDISNKWNQFRQITLEENQ